MIFTNSYHL